MSNLLFFIAAIASGLFSTWLAKYFAISNNIVNQPNVVIPQHTKPIAYLGGAGIYLGILIMSLIIYLPTSTVPIIFLGLSTGYMILGVVDDLTIFGPVVKFIFQLVLAILSVSLGVYFSFTGIVALDMFISGFWILVMVNAFNLTDVCDGLVGGLSVVAGLMLFFHVRDVDLLPMIVAGSTIGFLFFNSPPASIFMGDAGSHLLGFIFAYFSLILPAGNHIMYDFFPIALVSGVMLFELIFLIYARTKKGLKWWKGSPDHFSVRLQAIGKSKWTTNLIAWSLGILCCIPMVLRVLGITSYYYWISIILIFGMFLSFGLYLLRKEARQSSASSATKN